jgi:hypothetical protein
MVGFLSLKTIRLSDDTWRLTTESLIINPPERTA